jgi:hypothetical protein
MKSICCEGGISTGVHPYCLQCGSDQHDANRSYSRYLDFAKHQGQADPMPAKEFFEARD